MRTDRVADLGAAFCRRHLPPHVPNPHALLIDWDNKLAFAPDKDALRRCLTDYVGVLDQAVRADPAHAALHLLDATELALAYVQHGLEAGTPLPEPASRQRLAWSIHQTITECTGRLGDVAWCDAIKRLDALASLLEARLLAEQLCRRFLPPGVPDAGALLPGDSDKVAFAPSAAELQECVEAYTALLEEATRVSCLSVRWINDASELTLAYLSRALDAGTQLPEPRVLKRLAGLCRQALADAIGLFGAMRWYVGFQRIDILAWLIEQHTANAPGLRGWHRLRGSLLSKLGLGR